MLEAKRNQMQMKPWKVKLQPKFQVYLFHRKNTYITCVRYLPTINRKRQWTQNILMAQMYCPAKSVLWESLTSAVWGLDFSLGLSTSLTTPLTALCTTNCITTPSFFWQSSGCCWFTSLVRTGIDGFGPSFTLLSGRNNFKKNLNSLWN